MEKNYEFTIIMSNYNQEKYIAKAIDSVLSQRVNFDYLLLITDDCSKKDNSIAIIQDYCSRYPDKIKAILSKENGRYLKNILRAKAQTKTKYFCLLDADDYYTDTGVLQRAYNFLEAHEDYVIYQENVNCLYEDGSVQLFVHIEDEERTSILDDFFNSSVPITQTTGAFFRNVIFSQGIPKIMLDAVGTESERSFEGDTDRYVMHLKYGKAYFRNNVCGVYRITGTGIWTSLAPFEKLLLSAQAWYDYNRFYELKFNREFLTLLNRSLVELFKQLYSDMAKGTYHDPEKVSQAVKLYSFTAANKDCLSTDRGTFDDMDYTTIIVNFSDDATKKEVILAGGYKFIVKVFVLALRVLRKLGSKMGGVFTMTIQHNTTQHNTTQHNTTQHNTTQHNKFNITISKSKGSITDYKVSFLVTFYNQSEYVEDNLNSILSIHMPCDFEILAGDDGSQDNTVERIDKYVSKYPNIKRYVMDREPNIKHDPVLRASALRKFLLSQASGDFYAIIDGDDFYVSADFVADALSVFEKDIDKELSAVGFKFQYYHAPDQIKESEQNIPDGKIEAKTYLEKYYTPAGACIFRKYQEDEYLGRISRIWSFDDNDIVINSLHWGNLYFINKTVYSYRQTGRSVWTSMSKIEQAVVNTIGYDTGVAYLPERRGAIFVRYAGSIFLTWLARSKLPLLLGDEKYENYSRQSARLQGSFTDILLNGNFLERVFYCFSRIIFFGLIRPRLFRVLMLSSLLASRQEQNLSQGA